MRPLSSPGRREQRHRGSSIALITLIALGLATPGFGARTDREARRAEKRLTLEAARRGEYDVPTRYWREGPVRYLLSQDEDKLFRDLATPEVRVRFIKRFWAMRDPDPSSPGNPFRKLFYRRVGEANRYFSGSTKPGWKTDRGKIYIILGPPDERDERYFRSRTRALILWTYRDPPGGGSFGPNMIIRFLRDFSGEFRLSTNLRISVNETALSIGLQMQEMQVKSLPEPQELLDEVVNMLPSQGGAPFRTHHDFFGAGQGETIAILTLGVQESLLYEIEAHEGDPTASADAEADADVAEKPRFEAMARLVHDGREGPTYDLVGVNGLSAGEGVYAQDGEGYRLFQGGVTVEPGHYTAYLGVVDLTTGRIHSFRDAFEVPDYRDGGIRVSGITLASRLEPLPGRTTYGYSAPFVFGDLRAVPRAGDTLTTDENLLLYYQVHGTGIDAIDGQPDFDLRYNILSARQMGPEGEPIFTPFGNPIRLSHLHNPVQWYSFALADWPPATYRLEIEAIDNLTGRRSSNRVTFRVM